MGGDQRGIPADANVATWRGSTYLRSAIGSVMVQNWRQGVARVVTEVLGK